MTQGNENQPYFSPVAPPTEPGQLAMPRGPSSWPTVVGIIAIVLAVIVMMFSSRGIGEFVDRHPTIKMLALSFLVLIGVTLIAEGFDLHIPKGYVYFSMAFSVAVEMLNLKARKRAVHPVKLHKAIEEENR